jgi:hypothetical protein
VCNVFRRARLSGDHGNVVSGTFFLCGGSNRNEFPTMGEHGEGRLKGQSVRCRTPFSGDGLVGCVGVCSSEDDMVVVLRR